MSEKSYLLDDPLRPPPPRPEDAKNAYDRALLEGAELIAKPRAGGGTTRVRVQHAKGRMTVWERLRVLTDSDPEILWQNWGRALDGASIITGIMQVRGRDVAVYGHDFTVRAGAMDATNGNKLARLINLAAERGIPLLGLNDSAGAFVPAGVGGLDGYSEAFTALRRASGVVPSIMCMFGFNAGGGSYLPRQGSFVVQSRGTFFGLTGPDVVKQVLGEDVTAEQLGGPDVHAESGVVDVVAENETDSLRRTLRLLDYLPDNNRSGATFRPSSDPLDRSGHEEELLFRKTFSTAAGFNAPLDITRYIQQLVDHSEFFELQYQRARNLITAFARIGGHVVGIMANNSAVGSGQLDIAAANKGSRFVRFCNLYNIPLLFIEDTTGFRPGIDQETGGIVGAGRRLLDSIIDVRTPRLTLIVRNAIGGAYATFNSHHTGADLVFALPSARIAVMGPAGVAYVYKREIEALEVNHRRQCADAGGSEQEAALRAEADAEREAGMVELRGRYQRELMNPREALAVGSVSRLVMPGDTRRVIGQNLDFLMRHYTPSPMGGPQREFE
jgi:acetyl-CoA carboxylase carboxyltransferase component